MNTDTDPHESDYHPSLFSYLEPDADQIAQMQRLRSAAKAYFYILDRELEDGPDKLYLLRKVREVAMWANVCVTREQDGTPRGEG